MRFAIDLLSRKNRRVAKARTGQTVVGRAARNVVEQLEGRQMLVAVSGGQYGLFAGPNNTTVKVSVTGSSNGSFNFVGSTLRNGGVRLNDIPMSIYTQNGQLVRENLGGVGGEHGIAKANVAIGDPNDQQDSRLTGGAAQKNYDGLAVTDVGQMYGINRYTAQGGVRVDIARINSRSGTVAVEREVSQQMLDRLQDAFPGAPLSLADIRDVIGADFSPLAQNQLRFAMNINFPVDNGSGTFTRTIVPAMFTYNINTKRVTAVDDQLFGFTFVQGDQIHVDDFTFLNDGSVAIFGAQGNANQGGLYFSQPGQIVLDQFRGISIGDPENPQNQPTPLTSIAAMEAIPGEDYIIALTGTGNGATQLFNGNSKRGQLVRIPLGPNGTAPGGGVATLIGNATDDTTGATGDVLGENVRDLAWNPRAVDNFFQPGKRGLLMGGDSLYDRLIAYDIRDRFAESYLYAIIGNKVTSDLSLNVSVIDPITGLLDPYSGAGGSIYTNMVTGQNHVFSLGPTGGVYLGNRTLDPNQALTVPVLGADRDTSFIGGSVGVKLPKTVRPGIYIDGTIRSIYFAGTITGSININGSIDTLYAGNILVGDPLDGAVNQVDNFFVNGDMRNLLVKGGIGTLSGTEDIFSPGLDLLMNGRIQQLKGGDGFRGSADIGGNTSEQTIGAALSELEFVNRLSLQNRERIAFASNLIVDPISRNDTPETAQIIGSYFSKNRKRGGQATLNGSLNNGSQFGDATDYYGVPLLAGQAIQVQVAPTAGAGVFLSVIDPEGRIYATDLSNQNAGAFLNRPIQVVADKPGVWKLRVTSAVTGNVDQPYALTMDKLGEMAIGGLVTGTSASSNGGITSDRVYLDNPNMGIRVRNADFGAIVANGLFETLLTDASTGRDTVFGNPVEVSNGNLRSVTAVRIARYDDATAATGNYPAFSVPRGSIGLLRSDTDLYANINALTVSGGNPSRQTLVGGDIQIVQAAEDLTGTFVANGSIGQIRGGTIAVGPDPTGHPNVASPEPGYFGINQDDRGRAELGLIDSTGGIGVFSQGGPVIDVGNGGNVRYMRAGGPIYRSANAGSGLTQVFTGQNKSVIIPDDSGATITITPFDGETIAAVDDTDPNSGGNGGVTDPGDPFGGNGDPTGTGTNIPDPFGGNGNPGQGSTIPDPFSPTPGDTTGGSDGDDGTNDGLPDPEDIVGTVQVTTYPTNGRGLIVIDVTCDTGIAINTTNGVGDISRVRSVGRSQDNLTTLGTNVIDPATNTPGDLARLNPSRLDPLQIEEGTSLDVIFTGTTTNVFQVEGTSATGAQDFTRILNNTDGELVNIRAGDVGFISAASLGVTKPVNGVKIEPRVNVTDTRFTTVLGAAPFNQQRLGIFIENAVDIRSRGPLGNILSNGIVQNLAANSDNKPIKNYNEGIVAPIVGVGDDSAYRAIDIGEGLASSGSGNFSFAGIFVEGNVGPITNANGGGDLRGDVLIGNYLEGIRLGNGASILDADILLNTTPLGNAVATVLGNVGLGSEAANIVSNVGTPLGDNSILFGIGDINLTGNGGILNSRINGFNMGRITTDKFSYGVINSTITSSGAATMRGMDVGGLGIRSSTYSGGSFIGSVKANGNGKVLDIRNFSTSARPDEFVYFDAATGIAPNAANSLNLFLGTTKKVTKIEGVTNAGVLQDSNVSSSRTIGSVSAWEIRGVNTAGARPRDNLYPMQIVGPESIGSITTTNNINGLRISGGNIENITAGRDITQFQLNSNNRVRLLQAGRNYLGTANFNLINNGSLVEFRVKGNVNGTGFAQQGIRSIIVGGNLGSASSQGGLHSAKDINVVQVFGDISGTALLDADRTIKDLFVAGDIQKDATVRASNYGAQKINGTVFGNIITD